MKSSITEPISKEQWRANLLLLAKDPEFFFSVREVEKASKLRVISTINSGDYIVMFWTDKGLNMYTIKVFSPDTEHPEGSIQSECFCKSNCYHHLRLSMELNNIVI